MKFAHIADVHIGAWRDPAMKSLGLEAFRKTVHRCIQEKVDFVLIAGDLFNTAVPAIDHLKEAVVLLKLLKRQSIPVYVVPGSHDFNAGGKTILDVLEEAELLINVMKGKISDGKLRLAFTIDQKTGAKLTGIGGRKGGLDSNDYKALDLSGLEKEDGFKIFLFHASITEIKSDDLAIVESMSAKELPRGFDYYAGGHLHIVAKQDLDGRRNLVYPGPVFPVSFLEMWKLEEGGFYIYDDGKAVYQKIAEKKVRRIDCSGQGKSPSEINRHLETAVSNIDADDAIVLIKVSGELLTGKPSDVDFKAAFQELYAKGAFFVMRNSSLLTSKEMMQPAFDSGNSEMLEEKIIEKNLGKTEAFCGKEALVMRSLINAWSAEQNDGEKKYEYDARMKKDADDILEQSRNDSALLN